ncbi:disintegrin and metalloproteinase domain-containing protein 10 [Plakobranchus ocellatus]|uniref:Disintegrin and metalloproteinase domain-containing protein 10 n=1 Tax=Plakobranchus ocellatus TaxID=259542 RepID=A0AAV4CS46_9GAST|nr:disintegrin and metalloproteinase domain-containing protein 10 [Plakobranchus ocellatus]
MYKNDHQGNVVAGSKVALKNAVLGGANIRVVASGINGGAEQDFLVSGVNNVNIRGSEIYCTTGLFNFVNHLIDGNTIASNATGTASVAWFAWTPGSLCPDQQAPPTYSHFTDGGTHSGLLANLAAAVSLGKAVQLVRRDLGYLTGLDFLQVADNGNIVNGQSTWHVGQSYASDHVTYNTEVPYRWLSSWSTTGRRHNQRWAYGGQEEIFHNVDHSSLDWFVDPCWRRVFSHSDKGVNLKGNIDDLVTAIDQGHRVRVQVGTKVMEARALRVAASYVQAQLSDQIGQKGGVGEDKLDLADEAFWIWTFVDTNGGVYQEHFFYGNNSEAAPASVTSSAVDWFVDARPWNRVLEVDGAGNVISGSKADLQTAIRSGANIRLKIHNSTDAQKLYIHADNAIYYSSTGEDSITQSIRLLELQAGNTLVKPPRWNFYLANTKGGVEKAIYNYAQENSFISKETTGNDLIFYADDSVPFMP